MLPEFFGYKALNFYHFDQTQKGGDLGSAKIPLHCLPCSGFVSKFQHKLPLMLLEALMYLISIENNEFTPPQPLLKCIY